MTQTQDALRYLTATHSDNPDRFINECSYEIRLFLIDLLNRELSAISAPQAAGDDNYKMLSGFLDLVADDETAWEGMKGRMMYIKTLASHIRSQIRNNKYKAVPRLSEQDAPTVEAIREQFENWLTGEGDLPHLKYKNFGGSYITDEACMKWDAYKAGFKAALQNAAK